MIVQQLLLCLSLHNDLNILCHIYNSPKPHRVGQVYERITIFATNAVVYNQAGCEEEINPVDKSGLSQHSIKQQSCYLLMVPLEETAVIVFVMARILFYTLLISTIDCLGENVRFAWCIWIFQWAKLP